jgi:hypothetical protein
MKAQNFVALLTAALVLTVIGDLQAQKIKVIVDQDARGPATDLLTAPTPPAGPAATRP